MGRQESDTAQIKETEKREVGGIGVVEQKRNQHINDSQVIEILAQADATVTREQVCNWLKPEDNDDYKSCSDEEFATFLNGLINQKRGKKEGPQPVPEQKLTNNIIFRKLQIIFAYNFAKILDLQVRFA